MVRRSRPHFALKTIKAAFADPGRINRTMSAVSGAEELGLDERAVVTVITQLASADFEKSMLSSNRLNTVQDVYKPVMHGLELCVKFTLDACGQLLLISFKANDQ